MIVAQLGGPFVFFQVCADAQTSLQTSNVLTIIAAPTRESFIVIHPRKVPGRARSHALAIVRRRKGVAAAMYGLSTATALPVPVGRTCTEALADLSPDTFLAIEAQREQNQNLLASTRRGVYHATFQMPISCNFGARQRKLKPHSEEVTKSIHTIVRSSRRRYMAKQLHSISCSDISVVPTGCRLSRSDSSWIQSTTQKKRRYRLAVPL